MSYHRDFEGVRLEDDKTTLRVDATSIDDATGAAGSDDPATAFHVALVSALEGGPTVCSQRVTTGFDGQWSAFFPDAAAQFEFFPDVFVIGVAILEDGPPDIWQERHSIVRRDGTPLGPDL